MWELDHKESWAPNNWCIWTVVLEKTLESPLDCKEIKPVNPKGSQSWIFIGRTDAEASIFWPPDVKNWLTGKDPDAGKDQRQEEKGITEYEMVRKHHQLSGHEFEQALGDDDGQRSLACCSPWGHKEMDKTDRLHWSELIVDQHWSEVSRPVVDGPRLRCPFVVVESLSQVQLFATSGLQHARLPCPSPFPGVCSKSCPLSWWCHPTVSFRKAN